MLQFLDATYRNSEPMFHAFMTILCGTKELFPERLARTVDELRSAHLSFRQEQRFATEKGCLDLEFGSGTSLPGTLSLRLLIDMWAGICRAGDSIVITLSYNTPLLMYPLPGPGGYTRPEESVMLRA